MYMTINFKHLPLRHGLVNQSQILSGAFFGSGSSIYKYGLCHMIMMIPMPVYGEHLYKNLHLWSQKSYDLETRHESLWTFI